MFFFTLTRKSNMVLDFW